MNNPARMSVKEPGHLEDRFGRPAQPGAFMENRMNWADRPLWVRVGLFAVPSRRAAMLWMQGSLAFTMLALIAILTVPVSVNGVAIGLGARAFIASLTTPFMLIAPLWYWLAIRWTDEHEGWALHTWKS
jgi:hypothetical protein